METTIVCRNYIGMMENKMETTIIRFFELPPGPHHCDYGCEVTASNFISLLHH